jgi:hypothetical protein
MRSWMVGGIALLCAAFASNEAQSFTADEAAEQPKVELGRQLELSKVGADDKKEVPINEVQAEVIVLHATNDGKGIDPSIGKIPALERPPFSSYNSYKLLEKYDLKLPKGEAKDKKLPDGGKLALMFKEVSRGKKKDDPTKFVVSATIEKADGKQFLPGLDVNALKGEYFFIAGQKYNGGILVIGVKIN